MPKPRAQAVGDAPGFLRGRHMHGAPFDLASAGRFRFFIQRREPGEKEHPMAETTGTGTAPRATLGLTGLTSNAMALIAPGAFLWLTYGPQVLTGAPGAG